MGNKIRGKKTEPENEIISGIVDKESRQITFDASVSIGGVRRVGTFTAQYMPVMGRIKMGVTLSALLDGKQVQDVDPLTGDLAYMLSLLSVTLTATPSWWDINKIDDEKDLVNIFKTVDSFQQSFRAQNDAEENAGRGENAVGAETVENMQAVQPSSK